MEKKDSISKILIYLVVVIGVYTPFIAESNLLEGVYPEYIGIINPVLLTIPFLILYKILKRSQKD